MQYKVDQHPLWHKFEAALRDGKDATLNAFAATGEFTRQELDELRVQITLGRYDVEDKWAEIEPKLQRLGVALHWDLVRGQREAVSGTTEVADFFRQEGSALWSGVMAAVREGK